MTTEVKEVAGPVDPAAPQPIDAEVRASIERAVAAEHPFVSRGQIRAIAEADYYMVQIDAACFACRVVDAQHVQITRVKSEDHAVILEMPRRVRIPALPVPPSPPSPLAIVRGLWQQIRDARDPVRNRVNAWGLTVSPHRPDL